MDFIRPLANATMTASKVEYLRELETHQVINEPTNNTPWAQRFLPRNIAVTEYLSIGLIAYFIIGFSLFCFLAAGRLRPTLPGTGDSDLNRKETLQYTALYFVVSLLWPITLIPAVLIALYSICVDRKAKGLPTQEIQEPTPQFVTVGLHGVVVEQMPGRVVRFK